MAGQFTAFCKDCGCPYSYDEAYFADMAARGASRPERCADCRARHGVEIGKVGMPFFTLRPLAGRPPVLTSGGLGSVYHGDREHRLAPSVATITRERDKFAAGDGEIEELYRALRDHQVALVEGPTGSGKSTYLPYRLVEPTPQMERHWRARGQVVVTQPRIRAAESIASYVADLLGTRIGPGQIVGLRTGQNRTTRDPRNRLAYVTDGTLLNWIVSGEAEELGLIMIDEAHERSVNIDLILMLLQRLLPRIPHLRLVVASATINIKHFQDFFGGASVAPHITFSAGQTKGYQLFHRPDDPKVPKLPYDAQKMRELPRLVPRAMAEAMIKIATNPKPSDQIPDDILGFVATKSAVEDTITELVNLTRGRPELGHLRPLPLYRGLSQRATEEATGKNANPQSRRLIVATNIAETSLTIDGLGFVVDSGLIVESDWDTAAAATTYLQRLHSQAGCRQRWGRVGRYAPGAVHTLYTAEQFKAFPTYTAPEVMRSASDDILLKARAAGVDPEGLRWLDEPPASERTRATHGLALRGALSESGDITDRGLELSRGDPIQQMQLILADNLACTVEVGLILALLARRSRTGPFLVDPTWNAATRRAARRAQSALRAACIDDVDLYLKVVAGWNGEHSPLSREAWAARHFVDPAFIGPRLEQEQWTLLGPLARNKREDERRPVDLRLGNKVRLAIAAALPDRVFAAGADGTYRATADTTEPAAALRIMKPSVLADDVAKASRVVVPEFGVRGGKRTASMAVNLPSDWTDIATDQPLLGLQAIKWARTDADGMDDRLEQLLVDLRLPLGARVRVVTAGEQSDGLTTAARLTEVLDDPLPMTATTRRRRRYRDDSEEVDAEDTRTDLPGGSRSFDEAGLEYDGLEFDPEEAPDDDGPAEPVEPSAEPSRSRQPLSLRPVTEYHGVLRDPAPAGLELVAEVIGYDLTTSPPTILLRQSSQPRPVAEFRDTVDDLADVSVRIVEVDHEPDDASLNGLVVEHPATFYEAVLDPEDVVGVGRGELLDGLRPSTSVTATVLHDSNSTRMTLLPAVAADLTSRIDEGELETSAQVAARDPKLGVCFLLGVSRPEVGILHAAWVGPDKLPRPADQYRIGDALTCIIRRGARPRSVDLARLPAGVEAGELPEGTTFAADKRELRQARPLSERDWRRMMERARDGAFRWAFTELLALSNLPEVRLRDPLIVQLATRYGKDDRLTVRLAGHRRDGVTVIVDETTRIFVPRAELDWQPDPRVKAVGEQNAELTARVIHSDPDEGVFALTLKLPENDPMKRYEAFDPATPVEAKVTGVNGASVFANLGWGVSGRFHALANAQYRDGDPVTVYILGIFDHERRALSLSATPGTSVRFEPPHDFDMEAAIRRLVPGVSIHASVREGDNAMAIVSNVGPCVRQAKAIRVQLGLPILSFIQFHPDPEKQVHALLSLIPESQFGGTNDRVLALHKRNGAWQATIRAEDIGRVIGKGGAAIKAAIRLIGTRIVLEEAGNQ